MRFGAAEFTSRVQTYRRTDRVS